MSSARGDACALITSGRCESAQDGASRRKLFLDASLATNVSRVYSQTHDSHVVRASHDPIVRRTGEIQRVQNAGVFDGRSQKEAAERTDASSAAERWRRRCTVGIISAVIRDLKKSRARVNARSRGV